MWAELSLCLKKSVSDRSIDQCTNPGHDDGRESDGTTRFICLQALCVYLRSGAEMESTFSTCAGYEARCSAISAIRTLAQ